MLVNDLSFEIYYQASILPIYRIVYTITITLLTNVTFRLFLCRIKVRKKKRKPVKEAMHGVLYQNGFSNSSFKSSSTFFVVLRTPTLQAVYLGSSERSFFPNPSYHFQPSGKSFLQENFSLYVFPNVSLQGR